MVLSESVLIRPPPRRSIVQHFLIEIFSCQVFSHSDKLSRLNCKLSISLPDLTVVYNFASSAKHLETIPGVNTSVRSFIKITNSSGPGHSAVGHHSKVKETQI